MTLADMLEELHQRKLILDQFCSAWSSEYRQRGGTVYCGKGCSGCCSLVVNCTLLEALQIAAVCTPQQQQQLQKLAPRLKATADRCGSLKEWLAAYRSQLSPCLFLASDGTCSVYEVRPLSCRSLLSTCSPNWCTTDFSSLSSEEKQTFMAGLDRSAAAFPTHYAATTQEIGRELEEATLRQMESAYGFSLVGCLPWLVWLELQHRISGLLAAGEETVRRYLAQHDLDSCFLLTVC